MPDEVGGEKILPASPRKRERVREEGNVAKSQDLNAAWTMLVALVALYFLGPMMFARMVAAARYYFADAVFLAPTAETFQTLTIITALQLGNIVLPLLVALLVAGVAVNIAQVGLLFAPKALMPRFDRLNIFTGMSKFVSVRSLVELVKSLLKLGVVGYVVYLTLRGRWNEMFFFAYLTPYGLAKAVAWLVFDVWFRVVITMIVIGILDYAYQRWQYEQEIRMTHREVQEETKEMEGDPRVRQRIRQIQRRMAMQRMMREVPTAEVVITNPTTYAVALRYDMRHMDAPRVVAKGARLVAERIRDIAVENDVPIVERPELARALYRDIEIGQGIPERLFRGVAEVLAFVYEIDRRVEKIRERREAMAVERAAV